MTEENKDDYEYGHSKFFNWFFHVGVIFNVVLVIWMVLVFTDVL
jgi:hypothetical protein